MINQYYFIKKNFKNFNKSFLNFFDFRSMISNLRIANQIKELIKIIDPKLVILPFEGHAWERVVIKLLKDNNSKIKIASYQFGVTTPRQHSIFRPLKKQYNPDIILTSGSITLKKFKNKYSCPVLILGSNKYSKYKKKYIKKFDKNFLIIPEAFEQETNFLFKFSIECAKKYPEYNFYFRLHPMYKFKLPDFSQKPSNFNLSNVSLNDDFKRSNFVLFRGSAAVFEAVSAGLNPIYVNRKNEPSINPLHEILDVNFYINNSNQLYKIQNLYKFDLNLKKIIRYCNQYFEKLNFKSIIHILN